MSNKSKKATFNLIPLGIHGTSARPLLAYPNTSTTEVPLDAISLPPFGTFVAAVK
jgi:hypothetical protein